MPSRLMVYEILEDDRSVGVYTGSTLIRRGMPVFGTVLVLFCGTGYFALMNDPDPEVADLTRMLQTALPWAIAGAVLVLALLTYAAFHTPKPKPHRAELWLEKKTGLIRHSGYTAVRPNINETAALQILVFPRARDGSYPYHIVFSWHDMSTG